MLNQIVRYLPVIAFLKKHPQASILEVWSWSQWLWKFYKKSFTGVDFTTDDYSDTPNKTNRYMSFVKGICTALPFADNSFDVVFSLDMIEHLRETERLKAFQEMVRVSKNDIIIAFPCWILAKSFDTMLYEYILSLGRKVPLRLQEHIDRGHPQIKEIEWILSQIKDVNRSLERNVNIWIRQVIVYLETFVWRWDTIGILLAYVLQILPISFNNNHGWYRLYIKGHKW